MNKSDFNYDLPKKLIAQHPAKKRTQSRLMILDKESDSIIDEQFTNILEQLNKGDLLVFNNTKVIPARLIGHKATGAKVEVFVERLLNDQSAIVMLKTNKAVKLGLQVNFGTQHIKVTARKGMFFLLETPFSLSEIMSEHGHMPLPPYIQRDDAVEDHDRYQTVYAEQKGAVAAPTAGLHFDDELLKAIKAKGVNTAFVTLHVGAGTFQPVKTDSIENHIMHKEWLEVNDSVCDQVLETKSHGGKVIAVGTTAVRCLETASSKGEIKPYKGDTNIFIYPGYEFKVIDGLLTNFHLPESTLIMLVSTLYGQTKTMKAYQHAVENKYRFFSYGDAMLIL